MISLFVKGFFVGVGKIIPGVSGSVLAISFGIYDKIIDIISHFFKKIKENISFLLPIMLGFIISIAISSNILSFLINRYYVVMMFIFIGLIIGGIPGLVKKTKFNILNIVICLLSFILILLLSFIKTSEKTSNYSSLSFIIFGFIEAFTTIVPGISGTAVMMIIGCYNQVIEMFSNLFVISNLKYLIPFLIGTIIGAIIISRIISYLLKKYSSKVFASIIGFVFGSIVLLIFQLIPNINNISEVLIGLILMFISIKMSQIIS